MAQRRLQHEHIHRRSCPALEQWPSQCKSVLHSRSNTSLQRYNAKAMRAQRVLILFALTTMAGLLSSTRAFTAQHVLLHQSSTQAAPSIPLQPSPAPSSPLSPSSSSIFVDPPIVDAPPNVLSPKPPSPPRKRRRHSQPLASPPPASLPVSNTPASHILKHRVVAAPSTQSRGSHDALRSAAITGATSAADSGIAATAPATAAVAGATYAGVVTAGALAGNESDSVEASGLALHRSARRWLDGCINRSAALLDSKLPSSEYWRERRHFRLYQHQLCILSRYAPHAASVLDVGSALPPFVNALGWIARRTILGPRFAGNVAKGGEALFSLERIESKYNVTAVEADFLEWRPPGWPTQATAQQQLADDATPPPPLFDLVLCSEVVEHIATPREFVRKLLAVGAVVVLSVPYRWARCDNTRCHHKQNQITRDKIAVWAGRQPLAYDIVEEASGERRIICVYRRKAPSSAASAALAHSIGSVGAAAAEQT